MRLSPLPEDQWDDRVRHALSVMLPPDRINPHDAGNILGTLVHHPDLARAYLGFNIYLLRGSALSERLREIALLRIVQLRNCPYLWDHHVPLAQRAGLTAQEIDDIRSGHAADELDRTVLRAVDELNERTNISDKTWEALGGHLDDRQRMDLVFTIGAYCLLAMAVNTFGIEDEHQPTD
jgi:alkylhydroperoxidase family enzyme